MTKIIFIFALLLSLHSDSITNKTYGNVIVSKVTSVYDGDTFRAIIQGYPDIVGNRIGIRIRGIDTPEMRGKCQKEKDLAHMAKQVTIKALKGANVIELRNMKRGKYFRIVADVYVDNNVSVGSELIKNDLAVTYSGGTKVKDWCQ